MAASSRRRPGGRRWLGWVAAFVAVVLGVQLGAATPTLAAPSYGKGQAWVPKGKQPTTTPVPRGHQQGDALSPASLPAQPPPYKTPPVHLPAAGTASVALTASAPALVKPDGVQAPTGGRVGLGAVQVPGSPVWVSAPDAATGGVADVSVTFAGVQAAGKAGLSSGLLLQVSRADNAGAIGRLQVQLDTTALAGEYGGNYAQRLRWVQLPACAMSTPEAPQCQTRTPIAVGYDRSGRLTTDVTLTPQTTGGSAPGNRMNPALDTTATSVPMVVLAADSVPAGSAGTYAATSIKSSDQWSVGSTGGFSYDYPITAPPTLGGAVPTVALGYSSASVDGLTASNNAQASWVGSGWSYDPGFIERSYQPCSDDGITGSGDTCWALGGHEVSLNGNGSGGQIVHDDTSKTWHLSSDQGATIHLLTGANNGAYNGEYWVITQQDGTRYYYGAGHLPGVEGGTGIDPASNAAWTQPVYCPNSGDPCYSSGTGQQSYAANMAYRWNLDYVVDPHGNTITYTYATEGNFYARGSSHTTTSYVRGGYLTQINYGWRSADVAAQASPTPAVKVVFTPGQRCTGSTTECSSVNNLNATTKGDWPDTPYDLVCPATGTCPNGSISYFSTVELTQIQTLVNEAGTYQPVDTYALAYTFPSPGDSTSPSPWLNSITHTGNDGGTAVPLPAVIFGGSPMANRVQGSGTWPDYKHLRLSSITTETGELISVGYAASTPSVPACSQTPTALVLPTASNDTMLCYQQYWSPPVGPTIADWFNKYVVTQVKQTDAVAGAPAVLTNYSYVGAPAWHRNDSPLTKNEKRTWDQFRGFSQVLTKVGAAPDPVTQTSTTYLRGMNGDYTTQTGGAQRSVTVTDSLGDQVVDNNVYADMALENDTYNQAGGSIQTKQVNLPWSAQTAAHSETTPAGLPAETANFVQTGTTKTASLLASGTWRTTQTISVFSPASGRLQRTDNQGDLSLVGTAGSQETCTTGTYATPPGGSNAGMVNYPNRKTTVSVGVGGPVGTGACPAPTVGNTITDTLTFYDGNTTTAGVIGSVGDATQSSDIDHYTGSTPVYTPVSSGGVFDNYGRSTSSTDARGLTITTTYTPATGQLPTSSVVTNTAKNWTTTTTLDQARQLPTKVVDLNGNTTSQAYDGLGRLTKVWLPGRAFPQTASIIHVYGVNGTTAPSWTLTETLRDDATDATAYTIVNGFGRTRQTQTVSLDGTNGSLVTDTFYDSHGWPVKQTNPYYEKALPASTIYPAADSAVPGETLTTYDGRGRVVSAGFYSHAQPQWQTTTAYPGADRTDVTPPAGGTATSTFTNALGQTTALWNYTTPTPDGVAADAKAITYTYTPAGKQATVTGPAGQVWTYTYDLAGHQIAGTDPDAGSSSATYNTAGDVLTTTDGRGQSLAYKYEPLTGRKIALYAGTDDTGTLLATWSYDTATLGNGKLASSTSYVGGASGAAYTTAITGYTNRGAVTGTSVTIPTNVPADEAPLAGTYSTSISYKTISGLPASTAYGADGGLPAETVGYGYNQNGIMNGMGGNADYFTSAIADPFGRNTTVNMGDMPNQVVQRNFYDDATARLIKQTLEKETAATGPVEDVTTLWNPAGLVTATLDSQDGATNTDLQCYSYNQLGQLTNAWTDNAGTTTNPSSVTNIGGCNTSTPTASTLGGPAKYWQSYTYNDAGNRTNLTDHATDGNPAHDTGHTYTYTGATGTGGQPDAVQSITNIGPAGTTTDTYHYDPAGNTATRTIGATGSPNQTIGYDAQGRTQTLTDSVTGNTANYRYDADGNLLLQRDTKAGVTTVTLYLGGEQLTLTTNTGAVNGLRYYPTPGGPTEIRSSTGTLTYEYTNNQGTGEVTIDAGPSQAQTRRYYTPYGQARGTTPGTWVDNHAFLNKPADQATGLDLLGARNYDPTTGHFLQRDPIQETKDIGQLGGYTYAANNPVTGSDPTGTTNCVRIEGNDGPCASALSTDAGKQQLDDYETHAANGDASGGCRTDNACSAHGGGKRGGCTSDNACNVDTNVATDRYTAVRDFLYDQIIKMLGSSQFSEIQDDLTTAHNPPWWIGLAGGADNFFASALEEWAAMVAGGHPWDFKDAVRNILNQHPPQNGELPEYTRFDLDPSVQLYLNIWANISYGYVGRAAGFDSATLQSGAEVNAIAHGFNTEGNWIGRQIGIDLYDDYKPDQLTPQAISHEINAHLSQLQPYSEWQPFPSGTWPSPWQGGNLYNPFRQNIPPPR